MYVPNIRTRTTNVELDNERRALIIRKLSSLGRLLSEAEQGDIDVVIRSERHHFGGSRYYLSVKLTTTGSVYYAVAIERRLEKALNKTRDTIKRSLSHGGSHANYLFGNDRMHLIDHYRLMLGNH